LEANCQGPEKEIKDNLENGKEYVWIMETPVSKFDVGQTSFENKRNIYRIQIVSTTKGGKAWIMD